MKCIIHEPNCLSVYGHKFLQIGGKNPLKRDNESSSKSALIPISPANAFVKLLIEPPIFSISTLNLSNS